MGESKGTDGADEGNRNEWGTRNPMFKKQSMAEMGAPSLESDWHMSRGKPAPQPQGIENTLGVLYGVYKPEFYYFDIINFFHKLILWATLVFFGYGSQLQVGTALLLCVIRLKIHTRFEPYRARTDNWLDYIVLITTALLGLGGLMLQYLEAVKDFAVSKNDRAMNTSAVNSIRGVELSLNISVIAVMVAFVVFLLHIAVGNFVAKEWRACLQRCSNRCTSKQSKRARIVRERERQKELGGVEQTGATAMSLTRNTNLRGVSSTAVVLPPASVEMVHVVGGGGDASAAPSSGRAERQGGREDSRREASNASRSRGGVGRRASNSLAGIVDLVPPSPVVDNAAEMSVSPSSSSLPSSGSPGIDVSNPSESGRGEVELEGGRAASNSVVAANSTMAVATTGESKGYDVSGGNDCDDGDPIENGRVGVPDLAERNKAFFQIKKQERKVDLTEAAREKQAVRSQISPKARQVHVAEEHGRAHKDMIGNQMGTYAAAQGKGSFIAQGKRGGGRGTGQGGGQGRGCGSETKGLPTVDDASSPELAKATDLYQQRAAQYFSDL